MICTFEGFVARGLYANAIGFAIGCYLGAKDKEMIEMSAGREFSIDDAMANCYMVETFQGHRVGYLHRYVHGGRQFLCGVVENFGLCSWDELGICTRAGWPDIRIRSAPPNRYDKKLCDAAPDLVVALRAILNSEAPIPSTLTALGCAALAKAGVSFSDA